MTSLKTAPDFFSEVIENNSSSSSTKRKSGKDKKKSSGKLKKQKKALDEKNFILDEAEDVAEERYKEVPTEERTPYMQMTLRLGPWNESYLKRKIPIADLAKKMGYPMVLVKALDGEGKMIEMDVLRLYLVKIEANNMLQSTVLFAYGTDSGDEKIMRSTYRLGETYKRFKILKSQQEQSENNLIPDGEPKPHINLTEYSDVNNNEMGDSVWIVYPEDIETEKRNVTLNEFIESKVDADMKLEFLQITKATNEKKERERQELLKKSEEEIRQKQIRLEKEVKERTELASIQFNQKLIKLTKFLMVDDNLAFLKEHMDEIQCFMKNSHEIKEYVKSGNCAPCAIKTSAEDKEVVNEEE